MLTHKIKFYLSLAASLSIDALFIAIWTYLIYALDHYAISKFGFTGITKQLVSFTLLVLDLCAAIVVMGYAVIETCNSIAEILKPKE